MSNQIKIFILPLLFLAQAALGQMPTFWSYPISSDLNRTNISAAVEDNSGLLWIFAQDGIWLYDGNICTPYRGAKDEQGNLVSMASPKTALLSAYRPNWIWIGNNFNGLWGLDITTGRTVHYRHDPTNDDSPGGNSVTSMLETEDHKLWFTSDNFALNCFDGQKFRKFSPRAFPGGPSTPGEGGALGELKRDVRNPDWLWAGSRFGIYRFDRKTETFEFFRLPKPQPAVYEGYLLTLYMAPDGIIWAGGPYSSIQKFDPAAPPQLQWTEISPAEKSETPLVVTGMAPYDDTHLMVFSAKDPFWICNTVTGKLEPAKTVNSGNVSKMLSNHMDPSSGSRSWFILSGVQVARMTTVRPFFQYRRFSEQNPTIEKNNWQRSYCFSPDNKHLFLGTLSGNGLLRRDWRRDTIDAVFPVPQHPNFPDVMPMLDDLFFDPDGSTLWIGSSQGLMFWRAGDPAVQWWTPDRNGILPSTSFHITAIYADEKRLWLGTLGNGIFILDKKTGALRSLFRPDSDLSKKTAQIRRIFCDNNKNLWVGGDEGLLCIAPETETILEKFMPLNDAGEMLSSDRVNDIEQDSAGVIWLGTFGGLNRLDLSAPRGKRLSVFKNKDVNLADCINDLTIGSDGRIWLATEFAITIFDPHNSNFVNYGTRDGLFPGHRMVYQIPGGGPFISGANYGFMQFEPAYMTPGPAPKVYWRDFRVFDKPAAQSADLNNLSELVLQSGQNHFSFEFGAVNYEAGARNKFAYQLEGVDADWVYSGDRSFANYTNLAPGKYLFKVKAANRYGIWSESRSISVRILPPYYLTWWFLLLVLLAISLLGWQASLAWEERRQAKAAQRIIDYFANSNYTGNSVEEILWDVARNCISRLNFEDAVIYILDPTREILIQKAVFGPKNMQEGGILNTLEIPLGEGIVGSVAARGKAEIISDTRLDARYIIDVEQRLSEIAVPIIHAGRVIGVIDSEHSQRNFFSVQHLDILQSIANLVADKIVKAEAEETVRRKEAELRDLDKRLVESELTALKAQMNPHFLFNCLNSINWYIVKNRTIEASKYLTKFSRLIRLILDNSKYQKIPLSAELETLRLYIEMESIRFEQKFEYQIELDENLDADELKIAPMILQPYVENAIWHGLMPLENQRQGLLRVIISVREGNLYCIIEDNGIGREAARHLKSGAVGSRESQGMRITAERVSILNQHESGIDNSVQVVDIHDVNGVAVGTQVALKLPLEV